MLVLSRKQNQCIIINFGGEQATLEILRIDGNRVRIGITAPTAIGVHREEVWTAINSHQELGCIGQPASG